MRPEKDIMSFIDLVYVIKEYLLNLSAFCLCGAVSPLLSQTLRTVAQWLLHFLL
jgi:hypothetical protein